MSMCCDLCGKHPTVGRSVARLGRNAVHRRVKGRTARRFLPNIQSARVLVNGTPVRRKVCTDCLKRQ